MFRLGGGCFVGSWSCFVCSVVTNAMGVTQALVGMISAGVVA